MDIFLLSLLISFLSLFFSLLSYFSFFFFLFLFIVSFCRSVPPEFLRSFLHITSSIDITKYCIDLPKLESKFPLCRIWKQIKHCAKTFAYCQIFKTIKLVHYVHLINPVSEHTYCWGPLISWYCHTLKSSMISLCFN